MHGLTYRNIAFTIVIIVLVALLLAACQNPGEDPFQAGQQFRDTVDQFLQEAGEFVAGFCSASALPLFATGLAAFVLGKRTH